MVVDDLVNKGYVSGRLLIGISTKDITEELADYYELPVGVYIVQVTPALRQLRPDLWKVML